MSMAADMTVTLRLPTRTLFEGRAIRMQAVARDGAFGILPNHVDFVTALVPSVLLITLAGGAELGVRVGADPRHVFHELVGLLEDLMIDALEDEASRTAGRLD